MRRFLQRVAGGVTGNLPHVPGFDMRAFVWCAVACFTLPSAVAVSQFLISEALSNNMSLSAKAKVNKTLKQDLTNAKPMKANVDKLLADKSLASLRASEGDNNFRVVLDALPVSADPAAFAASLQNVLLKRSGVTITKLTAQDTAIEYVAPATTPQSITFAVEVTGSAASIKAALGDIEKSIRPVQVTTFSVSDDGVKSTARISGVTYYLPEKTLQLQVHEVKRP